MAAKKVDFRKEFSRELVQVNSRAKSAFFSSASGVIVSGRSKYDAFSRNPARRVYYVARGYLKRGNVMKLRLIASRKRIPGDRFSVFPELSQTSGAYKGPVGFVEPDGTSVTVDGGFVWNGKLFSHKRGDPRSQFSRVFSTATASDIAAQNAPAILGEMRRKFDENYRSGNK